MKGKKKSGKKVRYSPYERGAKGVHPLTMLGRLKGEEYDIFFESFPSTTEIQPLRQIIFRTPGGDFLPMIVFDWMIGKPEHIHAFLEDRGAADATPVAAFGARAEQELLDNLIRLSGFKVRSDWSGSLPDHQRVELHLLAPISIRFARGLAKIAFHYTLATVDGLVGTEPEFMPILQFVWDGTREEPEFVNQAGRHVIPEFGRGMRPTHWSHILTVSRVDDLLTAHVYLFAGPEHLPLPFRVDVGRDPSLIARPPEHHAHQFVIDHPDTPPKFDGVVVDLEPTQRIVPPTLGFYSTNRSL